MQTPTPKKRGCLGRIMLAILYIFGGLIALFVIVGVFQSAGKTGPVKNAPVQSNSSAPAATATPMPAPTPAPAVGVDVVVGEVRWKILSAENLGSTVKSENQFVKDLTTTGTFIKVRFEVENRGKSMATFAGLDLIDNQDRKYKTSSDAIMLIDNKEACVLENLNPNITKACTSIYEVPKDAAGLQANPGDLNMFSGNEAKVNLGL